MNRRSLLAAAAAASVAGCVGAGGSPGDGEEGDDTDDANGSDGDGSDGDGATAAASGEGPETAADPDLRSTDLVEVDAESVGSAATIDGEAAVAFAPDEVAVAGTVVGETGCHGAAIADVTVDDEGAFRVVVAAVDRSEPNRLCTQSLTAVGYELEAQFDGGVPETVAVVHDDARGRETVATHRPNSA